MTILDTFRSKIEDLRRIVENNWASEDVATDRVNPVHVVNNIWQRSLAFVSAWDYTNLRRRKVAVDATGRLLVSFASGGGVVPNFFTVTVGLVATSIALANGDRSYLIIENNGPGNIWLKQDNTVIVGLGYLLAPNQMLRLDAWSVAVWGIAVSGAQTVSIVER